MRSIKIPILMRLAVTVLLVIIVNAGAFAETYKLWIEPNYDGAASYPPHEVTGNPPKYTISVAPFSRAGDEIVGWSTTPGGDIEYAPFVTITLTGDMTLYAIWRSDCWTLSFDANGGTGSMDAIYMRKGYSRTIPSCGFTYSGYVFGCWAESSVGDVVYQSGEDITLTSDKTLYARWFILNGSCGTSATYELSKSVGSENYDVLTISGTGTVNPSGEVESRPWDPKRITFKNRQMIDYQPLADFLIS